MRIQPKTLGLGLLGLLLIFNDVVHADIADSAGDAYDATLEKAEKLAEKLKNAGHDAYEYARSHDAYRAPTGEADSRARSQEGVYARSNDVYTPQERAHHASYAPVTYDSLKSKAKEVYDDACSTLDSWKSILGDKWVDFKTTFSSENDDQDSFQNSINDFQYYQKIFEETGEDYPESVLGRVGHLFDNLKQSYEDVKNVVKNRLPDWSANSDEAAKSTALAEYRAAKGKYTSAKQRLNAELDYFNGKISEEEYRALVRARKPSDYPKSRAHEAGTKLGNLGEKVADYTSSKYDSLKGRVRNLSDDASSTLNEWQTTLGDKWDDFKASLSSRTSDFFHESTDDFSNYIKILDNYKEDYSDKAQGKIDELFDDVKDKYDNMKKIMNNKYQEWKSAGSETNDQAKEKIHEVYEEARGNYEQSKKRFRDAIEEIKYQANKNRPAATFASLKNGISNIYTDATNTLNEWQTSLGDKWDAFKENLSEKYEGRHGSNSYYDTTRDFQEYLAAYERTGEGYTPEAQSKIGELFDDLKGRYEDLKEAAKQKYHQWIPRAEEATEEEKSKALAVYDEARGRYYESKERLQAEFDYLNGKLTNAEYEAKVALKKTDDHKRGLLGRAANALHREYRHIKDNTREAMRRYEETARNAEIERQKLRDAVKDDYEHLKQKIKEGLHMGGNKPEGEL